MPDHRTPRDDLRLNEFLIAYHEDLGKDEVKPLGGYLNSNPCHDALIGAEYQRLEAERVRNPKAGTTPSAEPFVDPKAGLSPEEFPLPSMGHFRLLRELGRGGQAEVWLARDLRLDRLVALKVLNRMGAGAGDFITRLEREAQFVARLEHPAACTVYETGLSNGIPYIAMRYVEGETLAKRIAAMADPPSERTTGIADLADPDTAADDGATSPEGTRPPGMRQTRVLAGLIAQVARAIQAAHDKGIIHRDIKPSNIMIDHEGKPVVLDFGIAREINGDWPTLTQSCDLLGTPAFIAPERLALRPMAADRLTDVWSLGVTLYQALTLRLPFAGPTLQAVFRAIGKSEPDDPRRINPDIPRDLASIIFNALQKERARRYHSAAALADDLEAWLGGKPVSARLTGPAGRVLRWSRREPTLAALIVLSLIALPGIPTLTTLYLMDRPRVEAERRFRLAQEREELLAEATAALMPQQYDRAVVLFERVMHMGEESPEAIQGLALAYVALNQPERALGLLDRHSGSLGSSAAHAYVKARALQTLGRKDEATGLIDGAPRPKSPFDYVVLADRAMSSGEDAPAESHRIALHYIDTAIMLSKTPRLFIFSRRATVSNWMHDAETARRTVEALRLHWPESGIANAQAGYALMGIKTVDPAAADDAIRCIRRAIELRPDLEQAHFNLGVLLQAPHPDEAIAEYRAAIAINPDYADAHGNLGNMLMRQGRASLAMDSMREAIRIRPDHANYHFNLGVALQVQGRKDEAVAEYRTAVTRRPGFSMAWRNLGSLLREIGRMHAAVDALREAARLEPDSAEVHAALGMALVATRQRRAALDALSRAAELGYDPPMGGDSMSEGMTSLKREAAEEDQAEAELERHVLGSTRPDSPDELVRLAEVALRSGRVAIAAEWYRLAFERKPALAKNAEEGHRHRAACAAIRLAASEGSQGSVASPEGAGIWRERARKWLAADMSYAETYLKLGRLASVRNAKRLVELRVNDPDLASVRRPGATAAMTPDEQKEWDSLWARVDALLAKPE